MARQGYRTNPADKLLEIYHNFSGGMNTATANENMADHEALKIINLNLVERGPVSRRYGMENHIVPVANGKGQGYFRYYRNETSFDEITAVQGKLYRNGALLPITGLTSFQTDRPIEAVQFQNILWIATGTKLVEYDGTAAKVVEPYKPQPLDALYIGTNGLAEDPDNFMTDGTALSFRIDGVTFSSRYGVVNKPVTLTAFSSFPAGKSVEYEFEYRFPTMEEGKWYLGQAWSSAKSWDFVPQIEGDVQFRINMREAGLTVAEAQYLIPKYKVNPTEGEPDVNTDYINQCNRIILHWNRLIMYGDSTQPDALYISHLNNPRYFPVPNSLRLENGRNEKLTAIIPYRDMLVGFTPTTIQAIYGKSPMDFRRVTLNTSIGCIAPDSAKVFRNHVYFLSYDGVYKLKSVGYTEDKANVEKVDTNIADLIRRDTNACAAVHDGQYQIVFPNTKERFRCYIELGEAWVKDESTKLDFQRMFVFDNDLFGQSITTGHLMKFNPNIFNDAGHIYTDTLETKGFNFGQPYHRKKLKELQLMTNPKEGEVSATVYVYADSLEVKQTPFFEMNLENALGLDPTQTAVASIAISGKCYSTRFKFVHTESVAHELLGLAYIFKMKKPS